MSHSRTTQEDRRLRDDILTTLALTALLNPSHEAVRNAAKQLIPHAPGSMRKSLLKPLSESKEAYDIVLEEIVYPTQERVIGTVFREGYEYDLVVIYRDDRPRYDTDEITALVTELFLKRGIVRGRLYLTFRHAYRLKEMFSDSVDLELALQRSLLDYQAA